MIPRALALPSPGHLLEEIRRRELVERELEDRVTELKRSNDDLDRYAYAASHDLKTPLRAIENLAGWIAEDAGDRLPPDSLQHLSELRRRSERLNDLLDDLLAYARVGRAEDRVEEVDTGALVREIAGLVDVPEGIRIEPAHDLPTLAIARAPLEQVLVNLISNAKNAMAGQPEERRHLHVRLEAVGNTARIHFADTGVGIAPEVRERLFAQGFTTREGGHGLGLHSSALAARMLGGRLTLESEGLGRGATATLELPLG
jgi:signal transduction histidine kinase